MPARLPDASRLRRAGATGGSQARPARGISMRRASLHIMLTHGGARLNPRRRGATVGNGIPIGENGATVPTGDAALHSRDDSAERLKASACRVGGSGPRSPTAGAGTPAGRRVYLAQRRRCA
jgi:hypothetical protein